MCAAMPHADDELQSLLIAHTVLIYDLHVFVEERNLAVGWARECLQRLPPNNELATVSSRRTPAAYGRAKG